MYVEVSAKKGKVMSESFAAKTFTRWASILCRDKLRDVVMPHLPAVTRSMNDVNRRDILIQVTEPILASMINFIPYLPTYVEKHFLQCSLFCLF